MWVWGFAVPYGDSSKIEDFKDTTGITFPCFERNDGDSVMEWYDVYYTPRYFAICPDKSMKGFNNGQEKDIFIYLDNCGLISNLQKNNQDFIVNYLDKSLIIISKENTEIYLNIIDLSGHIVEKKDINIVNGFNSINIDSLCKGFYIVNIYSEKYKQSTTIKIVTY